MAGTSEYEFDIAVVEAVLRRLPETFDTYDVSQHPDMIRAHAALSSHRAWHNVVSLCLSKHIRGLEALPARRRGVQMWRKTRLGDSRTDLTPFALADTQPLARVRSE